MIHQRLVSIALFAFLRVVAPFYAVHSIGFHQELLRSTKNFLFKEMIENIVDSNVRKPKVSTQELGFLDCEQEVCQFISNSVPKDLEGTYYRNGPGKFTIGESVIQHPFDADGMVISATFKDGHLLFRNKMIQTKGFEKEQSEQKICYRGVFGTQIPGGILPNMFNLELKNTANTHVLFWGNRLFALWEGGTPYELQPNNLSTIGETNFNGLLPSNSILAAHHKIDPLSGRLILFESKPAPLETKLNLYEVDANYTINSLKRFTIPRFSFFHDFAITENYYLFLQSPLNFYPLQFILGRKSPIECVSYQANRKAIVYIINRKTGKLEYVPLGNCFGFHTANAYEEDLGNSIILDIILTDSLHSLNNPRIPLQESVGRSQMNRIEISRDTETKKWRVNDIETLTGFVEFPAINPDYVGRPYRYAYMNCGGRANRVLDFRGILKLDCLTGKEEMWIAKENCFLSEPVFASKRRNKESDKNHHRNAFYDLFDNILHANDDHEDDGYILTILSNKKTKSSELLVFDAKRIRSGPVHRSCIPVYVPPGLHGSFVPGLSFKCTSHCE